MLKTSTLLVATILCVTGCVSHANYSAPQELKMNADQGGLVFLREKADANQAAVNLSIDGQYLTSLLPGGTSQVAVCAQPVRVTAVQTSRDVGYMRKLAEQGSVFSVQSGTVTYILVKTNDDNLPSLTVMDETAAKNLLRSNQVHPHTLARVRNQQNCQLAEKPIIPVEKSEVLKVQQ